MTTFTHRSGVIASDTTVIYSYECGGDLLKIIENTATKSTLAQYKAQCRK